MRPLPAVDPYRLGVFTSAEALASGWTPKALHHAAATGRVVRLRPGVYVADRPVPESPHESARDSMRISAIAAVLANPTSMASHTAAAVLHELPVWFLPERPCVTVPPGYVGDVEGAHLHRARMPATHQTLRGASVSSIERTVVDVGREHGVLSALVVADAALHRSLTSVDALRAGVRACRGWPGVRSAREAVDLADGRAESPLETASRYKLRGQVPPPELQPLIFDAAGLFLGRCDFLWEDLGVVGEADGMDKYDGTKPLSLREEKIRQEDLENCGLVVVRWGPADLNPIEGLVARLEAGYARAQRRREPRRWTASLMRRAS
ncbi:MAG TPA: type IV toxin-antitoxin system AbiEi family antitoxin domain-containing protein [Jatrophihabitans sp.]|jgi:hypothetical protein|nr:type IV toxin-antitoxin system AbiEi family antitoxin domain-containing protein [Jatrophihabitans sp.]